MISSIQATTIMPVQENLASMPFSSASMSEPKGVITAPRGFLAAGNHVGIKRKRKDLAIILSEVPAKVAAVFTTNVVKAAPILWNQSVVRQNETVRAIVINSGNANACTGAIGVTHTEMMAQATAAALDISPNAVLVSSTGVIGVPLPIEIIEKGINQVSSLISKLPPAASDAAAAIMTTDTYPKESIVQFQLDGKAVTISGIAKGSGMIHPNMATMLSFITTDANISAVMLNQALKGSVNKTYNMISVDGDTSTNDMVVMLANGLANNKCIDQPGPDYDKFVEALNYVNTSLAKLIAADGEGATKLIEVVVKGASCLQDAQKLARSVVSSNLVKAAFFGQDANWGRVLCSLGYSGVQFDPSKISINFVSAGGDIVLMQCGQPVIFDEIKALEILKEKKITVLINMGMGSITATAWGCDLSYDYVRINGAYRT